jgi:hypothetical protein
MPSSSRDAAIRVSYDMGATSRPDVGPTPTQANPIPIANAHVRRLLRTNTIGFRCGFRDAASRSLIMALPA